MFNKHQVKQSDDFIDIISNSNQQYYIFDLKCNTGNDCSLFLQQVFFIVIFGFVFNKGKLISMFKTYFKS